MLQYKIFDTVTERAPASVQNPQDYNKWLREQFEHLSQSGGWELVACDGTKYFFKREKR